MDRKVFETRLGMWGLTLCALVEFELNGRKGWRVTVMDEQHWSLSFHTSNLHWGLCQCGKWAIHNSKFRDGLKVVEE